MEIDPTNLDDKARYRLFMGCIVPRPIAWVSTINLSGQPNLAPFSFFTGLAHSPPMLGISIGGGARKKDTLANIESTQEFVVNIVTRDLAPPMNITAMDCPPEVNEFQAAGVTSAPCTRVRAPRVANSPIAMECKLVSVVPLADANYHFCIGQVVNFHFQDAILENGEIRIRELHPVARLSAHWYSELGNLFELIRPRHK